MAVTLVGAGDSSVDDVCPTAHPHLRQLRGCVSCFPPAPRPLMPPWLALPLLLEEKYLSRPSGRAASWASLAHLLSRLHCSGKADAVGSNSGLEVEPVFSGSLDALSVYAGRLISDFSAREK